MSDSWPTCLSLFAIGVVPLLGDKLPMPSQDRVGGKQGSDLGELLASDELAFDCQSTSLFAPDIGVEAATGAVTFAT